MAKKIKTQSRSKVGASPKKKLKWEGFKITRVKLNPEQAVLSCCNTTVRDLEVPGPHQCVDSDCGCGSSQDVQVS